jgi:predicted ATPase
MNVTPLISVFVAIRGEIDGALYHRLLVQHQGAPQIEFKGEVSLSTFPIATNALVFARELLALNPSPISVSIVTGESGQETSDYAVEMAKWLPVNFIGVCSTTCSLVVRKTGSEFWLKDMGVINLPSGHSERIYTVQRIGANHRDFLLEQWDKCQLPGMTNSFIGRHEEIDELRTLLNDWSIVTITGLTGVGKSSLALATGILIDNEYPEGCFLIRVDQCLTVDDVLIEIATQTAATAPNGTNLVQRIAEGLMGSTVLLILDNCDHLVDGLRMVCEGLVTQCRSISILVTSIRPLDSANEHALELGGMSMNLPSIPSVEVEENALMPDAVRLFFDRAQATKPNFKETSKNVLAVTELCRKLDGVPLAIEMVASRLRSWTLDRIQTNLLAALTNEFPADGYRREGRSFADALAWSLASVPESQQFLLEKLSMFQGCFSYESSRDTWLVEGDDDTIFQMLFDTLVEQAFLIETAGNYRVVYPVKISMLDRLKRSERYAELRDLYIKGVDRIAIKGSETYQYNEPKARSLFEMHHDDMMQALKMVMGRHEYRQHALSLIEQLPRFWIRRSNCDDIEDFLLLVLREFIDLPPVQEARIRNFLGSTYYTRHEIAKSLEQYQASLTILEEEGFLPGVAATQSNIAIAYLRISQFKDAHLYSKMSVENARRMGDPRFLAQCLANYASAVVRFDYLETHSPNKEADLIFAESMVNEIRELTSVNNDSYLVQAQLHISGEIALCRSNFMDAYRDFVAAARSSFESGLMKESCQALDRLAEISSVSGDYAAAAMQLGFTTNVRVLCSSPRDSILQKSFNKTMKTLRERFSDDELQELLQRGAVAKIAEIVK